MKHWTVEQTELARQLLESGAPEREFLDRIGKTRDAAVARMERCTYGHRKVSNTPTTTRVEVSDSAYADAIGRLLAPRSITALLMGDPVFSQSALAKRARAD